MFVLDQYYCNIHNCVWLHVQEILDITRKLPGFEKQHKVLSKVLEERRILYGEFNNDDECYG